jgi:hypothetical protein
MNPSFRSLGTVGVQTEDISLLPQFTAIITASTAMPYGKNLNRLTSSPSVSARACVDSLLPAVGIRLRAA